VFKAKKLNLFPASLCQRLAWSVGFVLVITLTCRAQQTAEEYIQQGKDQLAGKHYMDAMASFEAAVKANPNLPEAYYCRGSIQTSHDQGLADLTKAISLKPDYAEAYYQRGLVHDLDNHLALALADYNKAIQLKPRYLEAYLGRAVIYLLDKKGPLAIADYTTVIELRPDGDSYYMRGNSYLEIGQPDRAIVDLTKAIQLDPTYYWSFKQRAKAYRQLKRYRLAEADDRKAAEIGPPK
jgi:tetratricopeptide (TPR) repeat protein